MEPKSQVFPLRVALVLASTTMLAISLPSLTGAQNVSNPGTLSSGPVNADKIEAALLAEIDALQKQDPNNPEITTDLQYLGVYYRDRGRFVDAESAFRRVLETRERVLKPNDPQITAAVLNIAHVYLFEGRFVEVAEICQKIIETDTNSDDPTRLAQAALALNYIAYAYQEQGKNAEAAHAYRRAVELADSAPESDPLLTAVNLSELAEIELDAGKEADAEAYVHRAQDLVAKYPRSAEFAWALESQGDLEYEKGNYAEAAGDYERAAEIRRHLMGPNDLYYARFRGKQGTRPRQTTQGRARALRIPGGRRDRRRGVARRIAAVG